MLIATRSGQGFGGRARAGTVRIGLSGGKGGRVYVVLGVTVGARVGDHCTGESARGSEGGDSERFLRQTRSLFGPLQRPFGVA